MTCLVLQMKADSIAALAMAAITLEELALVGEVLDEKYQLTSVIGGGGMGVVYRARHLSVGRDVAVKILRSNRQTDPDDIERFRNEAKIIGRLRHVNTVRLFDDGITHRGDFFFVTELLDGEPLSTTLKRGALPIARALAIVDQICAAIAEAHALGVVHRDLKPGNIFIERAGEKWAVKVIDFGIAKLLENEDRITHTGMVIGTPAYISPEQARGEPVDARSDLYALGVVFYHLLAGQQPFLGAPLALLLKHIHEPVPPLARADVPPAVEALMLRMLAKNPADRPRSAEEVRAAIAAIRSAPPPSKPRRAPSYFVMTFGFLLMMVIGFLVSFPRREDPVVIPVRALKTQIILPPEPSPAIEPVPIENSVKKKVWTKRKELSSDEPIHVEY